jgi:type IV pilus assembly protein PilF
MSARSGLVYGMFGLLVLGLTACTSSPQLDDDAREKAADFNAQLGLQYMQQGRNKIALSKLRKALAQNPDNAMAHHYLAELYRRLGKTEQAEAEFQRAMELAPEDSSILNNYGVFLCQQKKYPEARRYFARVETDPLYGAKAGVFENIGLCAQLQGDLKTAEDYLKKALRLNPRAPKALLAMAQLRFDREDYAAARKYYYDYLGVARQTPASLWLGILLEHRSGNRNRMASYAVLLKGKYPDSREAALLRKMEASGKL